MGGKNSNLIFADADLDNAVTWSIQSIFRNAGQICLSGSRVLVQRPIYDEFCRRFVAKAEAMRFGDLAMQLLERYPSPEIASRVRFAVVFIAEHTRPVRPLLAILDDALQLGLEAGEFLFASQSAVFRNLMQPRFGEELGAVREEITRSQAIMQRTLDTMSTAQLSAVHHAVAALHHRTWGDVPVAESNRQGMAAILEPHLWEYKFARVVILDVSSDYELMAEPMAPNCYPILQERWVHKSCLPAILPQDELLAGYLYDWHESNEVDENAWYVGMVRQELAQALLGSWA